MSSSSAKFYDLCRTCRTKSSNMLNLFDDNENGETLAGKIFVCTQVQLSDQIGRPSKICRNCAHQLDQAYAFRQLVQNSNQIFQQTLRPTSDEPLLNPLESLEIKMEEDDNTLEPITTISSPSLIIEPIEEILLFKQEKAKRIISTDETDSNKRTTNQKRNNRINMKTFECYKCKDQFSSFCRTAAHLKKHDAEEKFRCIVCGSRFILWQDFNQHLCHGSNIKCSYCDETFDATIALLNHLEQSHAEKTLFKCEKCAQFFSMLLLKQYHIMVQHANVVSTVNKPFECKICEKRFSNKYALRSHEDIHSEEKPFLCFECGKRFKTGPSLNTHRIGHNEKTLKCPDCPMTFNRVAGFRKHRDVHLNLKYKCNLCQAELRSKDALERHTRRHRLTDVDKKHQCTFCPMKFFKKDKLTRHIRTHTGEKPFKCPFCSDRAYAQKGDLTKHIKLHVGDKIYNCEICNEGFQYYADLKTHSFEHYKEEKVNQETIS